MTGRQEQGFTLMEIVAASFILVIGMAMISPIIVTVIQKNFHSLRHTQAVILAQNKIEDILNEGYSSPSMLQGTYENPLNPVNETGDSSGVFFQTWTIEDVNPIAKAKLITSSVVWLEADSTEHQVTLTAVGIDESN